MGVPRANVNYVPVTVLVEDLSTAKVRYVVSPAGGKVVWIGSTLDVVVDGADAVLTTRIAGTAITGGAITHALSGTAVGEVEQAFPTAANEVKRGETLEVSADGGASTTGQAQVTFLIEQE